MPTYHRPCSSRRLSCGLWVPFSSSTPVLPPVTTHLPPSLSFSVLLSNRIILICRKTCFNSTHLARKQTSIFPEKNAGGGDGHGCSGRELITLVPSLGHMWVHCASCQDKVAITKQTDRKTDRWKGSLKNCCRNKPGHGSGHHSSTSQHPASCNHSLWGRVLLRHLPDEHRGR